MTDLKLAKERQTKYQELIRDYYVNNNTHARDEAYILLYDIITGFIYNKYKRVMSKDDLQDLAADIFTYQIQKEANRVAKVGPDKGIAIALYQDVKFSHMTVFYAKKWRNKYYDEKLLDLIKETVNYDTINSQ